jgi:hypothetical protein
MPYRKRADIFDVIENRFCLVCKSKETEVEKIPYYSVMDTLDIYGMAELTEQFENKLSNLSNSSKNQVIKIK